MVVGQVDDVLDGEGRVKFTDQGFGVGGPDAEDDDRSGVAEDGVADSRVELCEILMGEDKAHAVLAQLREYGQETGRGEGLELVEVAEERPPLRFGHTGPADEGLGSRGRYGLRVR